jgi:glycosyltransferase involved in cell wall biosynthesis
MRILHVVKTSEGADWAAHQAAILTQLGAEVHVAVPSASGRTMILWEESGATIHVADLGLRIAPFRLGAKVLARAKQTVARIRPDIIHSHHVSTTLALRLALGRDHRTPRLFQVAGPLHLEHWASRQADLRTAGSADYWIASSRCIVGHYVEAGISPERLFLSYNGTVLRCGTRSGFLRRRLGLPEHVAIVGNINFIYPPKHYLRQTVGLKCHEDVIDALGLVLAQRNDVRGVLIGATFGKAGGRYEERLRKRALAVGKGRILLPGYFAPSEVAQSWPDFDCAVHVPLSENCGGVVEPLMAGIPTIASKVGGLPEIIIENVTGRLVPPREPAALALAVLEVLADPLRARRLAANGRRLAQRMFDVRRTASEIFGIYRHLLTGAPRPTDFVPDPADWAFRTAPHASVGLDQPVWSCN